MDKIDLDQFYTIQPVADKCVDVLFRYLILLNYEDDVSFLEPSAGSGAFLKSLAEYQCQGVEAYDISPQAENIVKQDFLQLSRRKLKKRVIIGNPPFGKRSRLAIDFINHSFSMGDTVAFILPIHFKKWSAQSKIEQEAKLIYTKLLPKDSFTLEGQTKDIRCVFQIWTKKETDLVDYRLKERPPVSHPDFQIWQYNNTKGALKVFNEQFDFAVPRQGFADYSRRETDANRCEKSTQWALFKAKNPEVLRRLYNLDFRKLSMKNTTTPGFGKADVVQLYTRLTS